MDGAKKPKTEDGWSKIEGLLEGDSYDSQKRGGVNGQSNIQGQGSGNAQRKDDKKCKNILITKYSQQHLRNLMLPCKMLHGF